MFGFRIFKKKKDATQNKMRQAYKDLIARYTSITPTLEHLDRDAKKSLSGVFKNRFECSTFLLYGDEYAIRFKDDMRPQEFQEVFAQVVRDLGEPDCFAEFKGYVWKKDGYWITVGLVQLNHNYDIPMICVRHKLGALEKSVPYNEYCEVADAIAKPLRRRGYDLQADRFYKINYYSEFGYSEIIELTERMLFVSYKKPELEISVVTLKPDGEFKIIEAKKRYKKSVRVGAVSNIETALETLLEETKDYHELKRIDNP